MFTYLTQLVTEINTTDLQCFNVEIGTRQEYSVEYAEYILSEYAKLMNVDTDVTVASIAKVREDVNKSEGAGETAEEIRKEIEEASDSLEDADSKKSEEELIREELGETEE